MCIVEMTLIGNYKIKVLFEIMMGLFTLITKYLQQLLTRVNP